MIIEEQLPPDIKYKAIADQWNVLSHNKNNESFKRTIYVAGN